MQHSPSADTEPKLVEMHDVTLWRGTTRVFSNLNLEIRQHERVAILGPNGSGKTTLLKALNREIYPAANPGSSMRILGRERWNVWQLRREIGVISHDLHQRYTPTTTALEVVVSGYFSSIGVHGTLAERVTDDQLRRARDVLDDLGLQDLMSTELRRMSTGQQRRCLLGRALVHDPATLILDEPTEGLDLAAAFDYLARIRQLARKGRNIVLVTHHLSEIPPEVDRVVLLSDGQVAADGSKAEVLSADNLSAVYKTPIRVAQVDGYYLAYPGA